MVRFNPFSEGLEGRTLLTVSSQHMFLNAQSYVGINGTQNGPGATYINDITQNSTNISPISISKTGAASETVSGKTTTASYAFSASSTIQNSNSTSGASSLSGTDTATVPPGGTFGNSSVINSTGFHITSNVDNILTITYALTSSSTAGATQVGAGPNLDIFYNTPSNFNDVNKTSGNGSISLTLTAAEMKQGVDIDSSISDFLSVVNNNGQLPSNNTATASVSCSVSWTLAPVSPPDIATTSAAISSDGLNVNATYTITGNPLPAPGTIDFYWATGPSISDETPTSTTPVKVSTATSVGTYTASASIASLGTRPTNATYIIAVADSPNADAVNNTASVQAPAAVFPASYGWDVTNGGIDFDYQVSDTLPSDVPVNFYWSATNTFGSSSAQLAASTEIPAAQSSSLSYLGFLHIGPAAIADPPTGTTYLLIVIDPGQTVLKSGPSVSALGYDPEIIVTSKYNGSTSQGTFGRFLAAPGAITDETLTLQLSDSLAALRPVVNTQVEDQTVATPSGPEGVLESHLKLNSDGSWDGRSYETDQFDPGTLTGPATLDTQALLGDGTDLKDAAATFDVQPLPYWLNSLADAAAPTFTPQPSGQNGSEAGYYTFQGIVADLGLPSTSTIPNDVPFVGGDQIGASAGFGVKVVVPINAADAPTASGYAKVMFTYLGNTIWEKTVQANFSTQTQNGSATLTVTPSFTLDPESLVPDGGFGLTFAFSDAAQLSGITLASRDILAEVGTVPVITHVGIILTPSYNLHIQASLTDTPSGGICSCARWYFRRVSHDGRCPGAGEIRRLCSAIDSEFNFFVLGSDLADVAPAPAEPLPFIYHAS